MDMVEKVARALAAHSWELGGNDHSKEPFVDRRWHHYTGQARAALEAMREPTDKPKETFAAFYLRTRGHTWANQTPDQFAEGLVAYVEAAVARLEAAAELRRDTPPARSE